MLATAKGFPFTTQQHSESYNSSGLNIANKPIKSAKHPLRVNLKAFAVVDFGSKTFILAEHNSIINHSILPSVTKDDSIGHTEDIPFLVMVFQKSEQN